MEISDIDTIAILVQFKNGNAHQVLATRENKEIMLRLLAHSEGGLKLTSQIEPVQFEIKK